MSADLERWLAGERRCWSDLVTDDDGTPAIFDDLVRRTEGVTQRSFHPV